MLCRQQSRPPSWYSASYSLTGPSLLHGFDRTQSRGARYDEMVIWSDGRTGRLPHAGCRRILTAASRRRSTIAFGRSGLLVKGVDRHPLHDAVDSAGGEGIVWGPAQGEREVQTDQLRKDDERHGEHCVTNIVETLDPPHVEVSEAARAARPDGDDVVLAEGPAQLVGDVEVVLARVVVVREVHEGEGAAVEHRLRPVPEAERGVEVGDDASRAEFEELQR